MVVFLQAFVWSMHITDVVLTQLTGFNPPLFISKHQAVKNYMRLQAYRPYKHDQSSNQVSEYHSYFKTSILTCKVIQTTEICYNNHCHVTTMLQLSLGHVD